MGKIVVQVCIASTERSSGEEVIRLSKRVGSLTVNIICEKGLCDESFAKKVLDMLDERSVKRLQHMCIGAGGCTELLISDNRLCCRTPLDAIPGLSAFINVFKEKGVEIIEERGGIVLCVELDQKLSKRVEEMYNAFLVLNSVYDTQRRIAESVAKTISVVSRRESR